MKAKAFLLVLLVFALLAFIPAYAKEEPKQDKAPAGPYMEILKDVIGLQVSKEGKMLLSEDEKIRILTKEGASKYSKVIRFYTLKEQKVKIKYAGVTKKDGSRNDILTSPEGVSAKPFEPLKNSGLYQDLRAVVIDFGAVEPGDIIEYGIDITDQLPYPGGAFWMTSMAQDTGFMKDSSAFVTYPKDRDVAYGAVHSEDKVNIKKKTSSDMSTLTYAARNVKPAKEEIASYPLSSTLPKILFTSLRDWNSLAAMIDELVKDKLELSADMKKDLGVIESQSLKKDIPEKIYSLLKRTKNVIPSGLGLGGYRFHKVSDIYAQKSITASDSALLLYAMLKHEGIDARLALIPSIGAGTVDKSIPSPQQFDLLAVAIKGDGGYIWLDPSFKNPNFGGLPSDEQGCEAFVLDGISGTFAMTPVEPFKANREEVVSEVFLLKDGSGDAVINLDFYGANARTWNELYDGLNEQQRQNLFRVVASRTAPNANVINSSLSVSKGDDSPFSVFIRFYTFGMLKKTADGKFDCPLPLLKGGDFRKIISEDLSLRTAPVFVGNLCQEDRRFRIIIPEGTDIFSMPESRMVENNVGSFQVVCERTANGIYYASRMILKKSKVEKDEFNQLEELLKEADKARNERILMTGFDVK